MASSPTEGSSTAAKSLAARTARVAGVPDTIAALAEQLLNRVIKPFDLVLLSRERIQETLDEAAERGRVTRSDANALVSELFQRGRQQTDDLLSQLESLWGRGSEKRPRRGSEAEDLPISGYDDMTARQVLERLKDLQVSELRAVREHERRHANRKSVLDAVERGLGRA